MSKYYKAEDVISFLNTHCPKDMWEYQIADLPTIDIVRCYGCKHYKEEDVGVGIYQWCELLQREVATDWYCASGERNDIDWNKSST